MCPEGDDRKTNTLRRTADDRRGQGDRDPALRANALAALADPEGLLSDVREVVIAANAARHLTVREVERAFAMPRAPDAASPEAMAQQLVTAKR